GPLRGDHGGEPGPGHGHTALRREPVCSEHDGADINRAPGAHPGALCAGHLRVSDGHHLRAADLLVPEGTGVPLRSNAKVMTESRRASASVAYAAPARRFR